MTEQIIAIGQVSTEVLNLSNKLWPIVESWLIEKYGVGDDFFKDLQIQLSLTAGRNWYYSEERVAFIRLASTRLYLYNIKEAGLTTPPEGLDVGVGAYLASSIIHEATHYLQVRLGSPISELETTKNQIDFMDEWDSLNYSLLVRSTGDSPEVN